MSTPDPKRVASAYRAKKQGKSAARRVNIRALMKAAHQIETAYETVLSELRGNHSDLAEEMQRTVFPARDMPETMRGIIQDMISAEVATKTASRTKTAGEVRFIKDRGDDKSGWAWGPPGPEERSIRGTEFEFKPKNLKPLAGALRSSLMALGHAISANNTFTRVKSAKVSPDGNLGGKGYIQKISDMRRAFMNIVEGLSSISDTLYDEINAPHWQMLDEVGITDNRERQEVQEIIDDAKEIKKDPEGWAEEEEAEMDAENAGKQASGRAKTASRLADIYIGRNQ